MISKLSRLAVLFLSSLMCMTAQDAIPLARAVPIEPIASAKTKADQLAVAIGEDDGARHGRMWLFERDGESWKATRRVDRVMFGSKGLAWGIGLHPSQQGREKTEGDGRAPKGRFTLGKVFGYAKSLPSGSKNWPYHQVDEHDAWSDEYKDPALLKMYNRHTRIEGAKPAWFAEEQMKQGDYAHAWKILIYHNYPNAVPGKGSAIFFHIWRGLNRATAGCTTMPKEEIIDLIRWLDPGKNPEFVLLTRADYAGLWEQWGLPDPKLFLDGKT